MLPSRKWENSPVNRSANSAHQHARRGRTAGLSATSLDVGSSRVFGRHVRIVHCRGPDFWLARTEGDYASCTRLGELWSRTSRCIPAGNRRRRSFDKDEFSQLCLGTDVVVAVRFVWDFVQDHVGRHQGEASPARKLNVSEKGGLLGSALRLEKASDLAEMSDTSLGSKCRMLGAASF